jgi:hypothetical protein
VVSQTPLNAEQRTLFMYYKVPVEDRAAAMTAVHDLMTRLSASLPELHVEFMQRPEPSKSMETWMEVYRCSAGVTRSLEEEIEKVLDSIPAFRNWPRAREIFVPLRMQ